MLQQACYLLPLEFCIQESTKVYQTILSLVGMFFRASSVLLFVLAIYFAYEGIHELHEGIEELALIIPNILLS